MIYLIIETLGRYSIVVSAHSTFEGVQTELIRLREEAKKLDTDVEYHSRSIELKK